MACRHQLVGDNLYTTPTGRKRCNTCRRISANRYYHANKERLKDYYKEWAKRPGNKERRAKIARQSSIKYNYGISEEQFEKLEKQQDNKCVICNKGPEEVSQSKKLDIDHDHKTGKVRGLLCRHCNAALGLFKDNTSLLTKAIKYLKKAGI